ncbi:Uncharacterised protein [Serratia marcescens]|uniref:hypothetical protein n=1 Tax=Serratia marcescens TaxID=615 RepID=UPI000744DC64|nr:hypothetical protein [Serratia marcescens]CUY34428.1 Uncharacterised protein [Serratia marcescens]CUY74343.1 Uncharacterised protein [Serratia marcescens]CUZ57068.1 Uncharacterised protein [Serratia marcescens]CVF87682.1 Uncharacterised protein [Serratia marcescens]
MSDYIIITLLTLAVMMYFAWRRRRSPYWRLGLALLALLFVLFAKAAYDWHRYG